MMFRRDKVVNWALLVVVIAGAGRAELTLVPDRLALDVLVWVNASWWRSEQAGLAQSEFVIERVAAPAGLTGRLSPVASLRVSGDISVLQPQDLYVDLRWSNGFGLRVGQFLLPLGMDAMADFRYQKMVNNSFLAAYAKPAGGRDIGVMGTWERKGLSAAAAVVNGAGGNAGDNNDRKDLCGRVTARPFPGTGLVLALHGYCGWPDVPESAWRTLGAEMAWESGPIVAQTEIQDQRYLDTRSFTSYVQFAYAAGLVEPCARFDLVRLNAQKPDLMLMGGVNLRPIGDNVRAMFDCFYRRNYQGNWSVYGFVLCLQAAI
jgi:hypothetical protein